MVLPANDASAVAVVGAMAPAAASVAAPAPSTNTYDLNNEDEIRDVLAQAGFVNIEIAKDQQALDFDDEGDKGD